MLIQPNQTILEGIVTSVVTAAGGVGSNIEMNVVSNLTPDPATDFLRPDIGSSLILFSARPTNLPIGKSARVRVTEMGGPHGGRTVLQEVLEIPASKATGRTGGRNIKV